MPIDPSKPSTNTNGSPAPSDEYSLTVGADGPVVLHDAHLIDTLAHFNRENIPERKPHAKGSGAFGHLEVTADVSEYTKASFLQKGRETPCWPDSPQSPVSSAALTPGVMCVDSR